MKKALIYLSGLIIILVIAVIVTPSEITFEKTEVISPEKP